LEKKVLQKKNLPHQLPIIGSGQQTWNPVFGMKGCQDLNSNATNTSSVPKECEFKRPLKGLELTKKNILNLPKNGFLRSLVDKTFLSKCVMVDLPKGRHLKYVGVT
jgi:hypothetical protein